MNNVVVLLLSAGRSSRFWPLPHKMEMSFLGKRFIELQIEFLLNAGFTNIILVGTDQLNNSITKFPIKKIVQVGDGQAAGILAARDLITNKNILVINADDCISENLLLQMKNLGNLKHNVLVGFKAQDYFPGGYLELDGKRVIGISEKPDKNNRPSAYVKLVCDYFSSADALIEALEKENSASDDQYERAISAMLKNGALFELLDYSGPWVALKYPWHTLDVMNFYLKNLKKSYAHKSVDIHKTAIIKGTVVLGKNVRILEYAKLVGPLYIGEGTIIGNNTLVRESMIGSDCVIGFGSDVSRSYLGNSVWLHQNYIGDSVIASGVTMGSGTTLANLRLDEKKISSKVKNEKIDTGKLKLGAMIGENVSIGVNTSIMPGVKIGKNSVLGVGVILHTDLGENSRCFIKQEHTISENTNIKIGSREVFKNKI